MRLFRKKGTREEPRAERQVRVRHSGPLTVATFDCHGCEGMSNLMDPSCRACVLAKLGEEGKVDQVVLSRAYCYIYASPKLSELARKLASLHQFVTDRAMYAPSFEGGCGKCVDDRMVKIEEAWQRLLANPHDLSMLEGLKKDRKGKKCEECSKKHYFGLLRTIIDGLEPLVEGLSPTSYNEVFAGRGKPFFVEGVWRPLLKPGRLIDSYELPNGRGVVRIYEQLDRPIPFYELDLPEFKLPPEQLELLYKAYRMKERGEPLPSSTEELYNLLLHAIKESGGIDIPASEIQKLSRSMASWIDYRVLEPFSQDDNITNLYIQAPPELQPMTLDHQRWGRCETGIFCSTPSLLNFTETIASRLEKRFDEVSTRLDAEIPELGMRLFATRHPAIWQRGLEMAIRKRRRKPWTQPLFLERGTLTPLASSLLSNVVRLGCSAFVIGEVDTAKTSQIETYVPEIGPEHRIIAFQDTEELHIDEFVRHGYGVANVRVVDPEQLEQQINAFLRGGAAYWLITEVREAEATKAALGAAARQGSQPVIASFHARSKREMFDLITDIFGLHEATFRYVDFIISTARFSTPAGIIRRIVEVAEVLKEWEERKPEYVELFVDDRKRDLLAPRSFLSGDRRIIERLNSFDLSEVDVLRVSKEMEFLPPEDGGSHAIPSACKRLGIDEKDFLDCLLAEARMKSDLLNLSKRTGDSSYLELPFVSRAYDSYLSLVKQHAPDYGAVLEGWQTWLGKHAK